MPRPKVSVAENANLLLAMLRYAEPGDVILLEPMNDLIGVPVRIPDAVTVKSIAGPERTTITSSYQYQADSFGCSIELGDQSVVEGITLRANNPSSATQLVAIGFGADQKSPPIARSATLRRNIVKSPEWSGYAWAKPDGHTLLLEDNVFESGWQCTSWCNSSGKLAQFITSRRNTYIAGLIPSQYQGAVSNKPYSAVAGSVVRGGYLLSFDDVFRIHGKPQAPRAVGVTSWYDAGSPETIIDLVRPTIRVIANGSKEVFDIDQHGLGTIRVYGGSGSGAGGAFLTNGNVEVLAG